MIDESNPAGRLYSLLADASKKTGDSLKVRDAWAQVLGYDSKEEAELVRALVEIYGLCEEVKRLVRLNPDLNHELYLASFPKIEKTILPINLGQSWKQIRGNLDGEVLARLQFCAEALAGFYSEESISEEDVVEISEMARSLEDLLHQSQIPTELKLALLEEVEKIRRAISYIRIKGAKGVKEALQSLVGAVVANEEGLRELKTSQPDVLERLGALLDKLDSFAARALKLKRMVTAPVRYVLTKITDPDDESEETDSE